MIDEDKDSKVLEFSVKIYRKSNGSCYAITNHCITEFAKKADMGLFGLELDRAKLDLITDFTPDIVSEEIGKEDEGLYDT